MMNTFKIKFPLGTGNVKITSLYLILGKHYKPQLALFEFYSSYPYALGFYNLKHMDFHLPLKIVGL